MTTKSSISVNPCRIRRTGPSCNPTPHPLQFKFITSPLATPADPDMQRDDESTPQAPAIGPGRKAKRIA
jgi:hypothetical protein